MSALTAKMGSLSAWLDDRVNPIVVKELRQAVKSRFIVGVLLLILVVLAVTLLLFVMSSTNLGSASSDEGRDLFMFFQGTLLALCMVCVPIYVGARLTAERASATSDLLYVTTIKPSSIIWGKLVAGMTVTALIFSVCAPFMVVTYLLRGIDPPTILFALAIDFGVVLSSAMLAIFLGALPVGWPVKVLLGMIMLAASFSVFIWITAAMSFGLTRSGIGSVMADPEFWWATVGVAALWLAIIGLVFFLAVAMISPVTSNRAFPTRLYLTVMWALSFAVALGTAVYYTYWSGFSSGDEAILMSVWAVCWAFILLPATVLATSERDAMGPRLQRSIPKNPLFRVPAFFLFSGAGAGVLWAGGLFALTLVLAQVFGAWLEGSALPFGHKSNWQAERFYMLFKLGICGLFILGYAMLGVGLRRALFRKNPKLGVTTAALVIGVMVIAMVVPVLIAFALDPRRWDAQEETWLLLNPLGTFMHEGNWRRASGYDNWLFLISAAMAGLGVLVNLPWFLRQVRAFVPPNAAVSPPVVAEPTDA